MYPGLQWHVHDPIGGESVAAHRALFGQDAQPSYDLAAAKVIVSFDCDLFFAIPGSVRYARDFANGRRYTHEGSSINRLYVAEPSPTITGSKADHRRIATDTARMIDSLAARLGVAGATDSHKDDAWLNAVAKDLQASAGRSLVVAGGSGWGASSTAAVAMINEKLGNTGKTVFYRPLAAPVHGDLASLAADAHAGKVRTLLILDSNPAYDAPGFAAAVANIEWSAHLGLYRDETAMKSTWHVPMAHTLESWGDAVAFDGTISPIQPLIAPLYGGKATLELLAVLLGEPLKSDYDLVTDYWRKQHASDFDAWWRASLRDGMMADLKPQKPLALPAGTTPHTGTSVAGDAAAGQEFGLQIVFRPSASTYDGRYANNAWLQELPDPITKLTWDNAAWMSAKTAAEFKLATGDVAKIRKGSTTIEAPVMIVPATPTTPSLCRSGTAARSQARSARTSGSTPSRSNRRSGQKT